MSRPTDPPPSPDAPVDELLAQLRRAAAARPEFSDLCDRLQAEVGRRAGALRASEERHRLLADLGRLVNSSLDLRQVFERAATEIRRLTGCDRVSLIHVARAAQTRHGFALDFAGPPRWVDVPVQDLRDSAAGWVLQHRRVRVARRLDQARPFPEDRTLFALGYRAYVYLPLVCCKEPPPASSVSARR
jgi:formate hydrogenlyase transcriptional activator